MDEGGKVLIEKEVILEEVPVGTPYETTEKEIEHYRFKEMDEKSAPKTGEVAEGTQDVIYVYQKEPTKEPAPQAYPPAPATAAIPNTGDSSQLLYFCLLMIICGTTLAIILVRGKDGEA